LILAWIEIHREELEANWKLLSSGEGFFKMGLLNGLMGKISPLTSFIMIARLYAAWNEINQNAKTKAKERLSAYGYGDKNGMAG